ncbi:suppressor of fused domain protein [Geomonas limicola]|uniref:suppressor of fused domain protein n=1 Tax=Geomonas limicola TaxID=2740186 RepID=UPI001612C039|nr:suppressor of fused domain protein [Geomonas limicola]
MAYVASAAGGGVVEVDKKCVISTGRAISRGARRNSSGPPAIEQCLEQISAHVESTLGEVETIFHEIVSDTIHIDVLQVGPTEEFPFWRLITSGMSDLPMSTLSGSDDPRYAELMITLPAYWRFDNESLKDENWYWPLRLLKQLARLPHSHQAWLGWGHAIPNGNPVEPYADNTKLCGSIILLCVPEKFEALRIDAEKEIRFFTVVPLYQEEMELRRSCGTTELLERLAHSQVSDIIDPQRRNTA